MADLVRRSSVSTAPQRASTGRRPTRALRPSAPPDQRPPRPTRPPPRHRPLLMLPAINRSSPFLFFFLRRYAACASSRTPLARAPARARVRVCPLRASARSPPLPHPTPTRPPPTPPPPPPPLSARLRPRCARALYARPRGPICAPSADAPRASLAPLPLSRPPLLSRARARALTPSHTSDRAGSSQPTWPPLTHLLSSRAHPDCARFLLCRRPLPWPGGGRASPCDSPAQTNTTNTTSPLKYHTFDGT